MLSSASSGLNRGRARNYLLGQDDDKLGLIALSIGKVDPGLGPKNVTALNMEKEFIGLPQPVVIIDISSLPRNQTPLGPHNKMDANFQIHSALPNTALTCEKARLCRERILEKKQHYLVELPEDHEQEDEVANSLVERPKLNLQKEEELASCLHHLHIKRKTDFLGLSQ